MPYRSLTPEEFEAAVLRAPVPVLLTFGAPYCPGCRLLEAALDALEAHYGPHLRVVRLMATDPSTVEIRRRSLWPRGISFSVNLIPVTVVLAQGRAVATVYGPRPAADLAQLLAPYLPQGLPPMPATPVEVRPLQEGFAVGPPVALELTPQEAEALEREQGYMGLVARWKEARHGHRWPGPI